MKPKHFHSELHLHLYGCISAASLWDLGKDRWQKHQDRLEWYVSEYEKAYGRRPDYKAYWQMGDGPERLQRDFEFIEAAPFNCFQACFNLLIALLPITPDDPTIVDRVLTDLRASGLRYAEVRTVFPPSFTASDAHSYLHMLTNAAARSEAESAGTFTARLAMSLPRRDEVLWTQYGWLRSFMNQNREKAQFLSAIDFSNYEEGFPPGDKAAFFAQVKADNRGEGRHAPLALLYHVGESFSAMSIMSSARWVMEAHRLGANRLGHAIALGLEPENLRGLSVQESAKERRAHLLWLQRERDSLKNGGYDPDHASINQELQYLAAKAPDYVTITYDDAVIAEAKSLQNALMSMIEAEGAIIESCPTSNFRIGQISKASMHPLPRFLRAGLSVVVSTDDPGIFAIDLAGEEALCRETLGLTAEQLSGMAQQSEAARSELLSRLRL